MRRSYERLAIEDFGRQLITSGDLDPVYIALVKMKLSPQVLSRWLISYWSFYHVGQACYMSEFAPDQFWDRMAEAAANEVPAPTGGRWPRGHERRHSRGDQGKRMVEYLRRTYGDAPEDMISFIVDDALPDTIARPFVDVSKRAQTHVLFGPWIGFKIADMVDRVLAVPVDFDQAAVFMFKDPMKAAEMLFRERHGMHDVNAKLKMDFIVGPVVDHLTSTFSDLKAPPFFDRAIGLQEVETVLCKWKSHMNGHYPLNNDIDEINAGLADWAEVSGVAREFKEAMPDAV